jgi:hypothetical protein
MKDLQKRLAALALAIPLLAAGPASAKSDLERQLALLSGGDASDPQAGAGSADAAQKSGWVHPEVKAGEEASCAMSYRDGINSIGYIGPSRGWAESYFFVSGPSIPKVSKARSVRVRLATDGDADQTVRAFHFPMSTNKAAILFKLTDFHAALDVMEDVEDIAIVLMEPEEPQFQQAIFTGRWTGGHAARETLRACLAKAG